MSTTSYDPYDDRPVADAARTGVVRRVSWGAIFAGVVVIFAVQFLLSLLGLGIGMTTLDPATGDTPGAAAFGGGAALWWIGASLVSVFIGGLVAGRLAGVFRKTDGLLHGFVTWCAATIVLLYLMTTTATVLVGGAFRTVGSALSAAGQTVAQGAQAAADTGPGAQAIEAIQRQARELMNRAANAVGAPGAAGQTGGAPAGQTAATGQPGGAAQPASPDQAATQGQPGTQGQPLPRMETQAGPLAEVYRLIRRGADQISDADRQTAVRAIAQQTGQSEEQARATLERWQREYRDTMANAERQAREAAEKTAKTVAQASLWSFLALVIGALCAAIGGSLGARRGIST